MINILITGKDSYIGDAFCKWLSNYKGYSTECIDLHSDAWKKIDFSKYQVVFHVAGIAHTEANAKMEDFYYKVNTTLTKDVAIKAKESKVRQFIFMSSMIVYGSNNSFVTFGTKETPDNFYGNSKLLADKYLMNLNSSDFHVVSLRPPMIFGPNSKGNFPKLVKLA